MTSLLPFSWWLIVGLICPTILAAAVLRRSFRKVPVKSRAERWRDQGHCHACGYNLKGVESYVCPECGIVRLYSARQWKAKLAADAAKLKEQKQKRG